MSTEFRFRYIASNLKLLVVSTAFVVAACNDVGRPDTVVDPSTVDDPSEPVDETDSSDVTDVSDVTEPAIESDESDVTDPADASEVEEPVLTFRVLSPETRTSYELGDSIRIELEVEGGDGNFSSYTVVALSNLDGALGSTAAAASTSLTITPVSPGFHVLTLRLMEGESVLDTEVLDIGICGWQLVDDFDAGLDDTRWVTKDDAYWEPRGWIEMTGNATTRKGAIFGTTPIVSATNAHMRFKISTGQCDTIGSCGSSSCSADGFALSVYPVDSSDEVSAILDLASNGGGLGFNIPSTSCASASDCEPNFDCRESVCVIDSFHIEFDTWENGYDPTWQNHMGLMLNADAGNHVFYQNLPSMEDNQWHTVEVTINGTQVSVKFDDLEPLGGEIPEFQFKGGSIAFTGSTGSCTNYHRFDDLEIEPLCRFID